MTASLGDRMKGYEAAFDLVLPSRLPVVIRVDGRSFHRALRKCEKPWDKGVEDAMNHVAVALCQEIQGAKLAYIQSDEVSVIIHGYERLESEPWFAGRIQKMASIAASLSAVSFEAILGLQVEFDARVFVLPEAEITNYLLWRQRDCERNSIQMLARTIASQKQCHGLNNDQLQELCFKAGKNWNDLPIHRRRGRVSVKEHYIVGETERTRWTIDCDPPRFGADREYVESKFFQIDEDPPDAQTES